LTEERDASDLTAGPSDPATSSPVTFGEFPHRMDPRFPSDLPSPKGGRKRVLSRASQVAQALCGKDFEQFSASTGCPEQRPICAQERACSPHGVHRDRPSPVHNRELSARRLRTSRIGHRDAHVAFPRDDREWIFPDSIASSAGSTVARAARPVISRSVAPRSPVRSAARAPWRRPVLRARARGYEEYANQASATAGITAGRPSLNTSARLHHGPGARIAKSR
jgi:hypothetical protein